MKKRLLGWTWLCMGLVLVSGVAAAGNTVPLSALVCGAGAEKADDPTITVWPTATAIFYGDTLADSTLTGGTASVDGSFAFADDTVAPPVGIYAADVTFTPNDTVSYNTAAGTVDVTVNKATPTVTTWPTASAIHEGDTLADSSLTGGSASVAGTFAFTDDTVTPSEGTYSASVTFTPDDATNYTTVVGSVDVTVGAALEVPTITAWPTASAITFGQTLADSTLTGGEASVAGSFAFEDSSTAPDAGTYAASVVFTPTDTNTYATVSGTVNVLVRPVLAFIAGPVIDIITDTYCRVSWTTNIESYGSVNCEAVSTEEKTDVSPATTEHSQVITGLTASTEYALTVTATNDDGESVTSNELSFTTEAAADTDAPIIVAGPAIEPADTTVAVSVVTDEAASAVLNVYDATGTTLLDTFTESAYALEHTVVADGLTASTAYLFTLVLTDFDGNALTYGDDADEPLGVTTLAAADTAAPVIVEGPIIETVGADYVILRWTTDELATTDVAYGVSSGALADEILDDGLCTQHSVTVSPLTPATTYYIQASSTDIAKNGPTTSSELSVTTLSADDVDTAAPVFVDGPTVVGKSDTTATIYWETDEPADTMIAYWNTSIGYASLTRVSSSKKTLKHEMTLTGLTAAGVYIYYCHSTDASGNCAVSYTHAESTKADAPSFTTDTDPDVTAPAFSEGPELITLNSDFASLRFVTDEIASYSVTYWADGDEANARTTSSLSYVLEQIVALTNLAPETTYYYIATVTDPSGNAAETATMSFVTPAASANDTAAPAFTTAPRAGDVEKTSATITWSADKYASGEVWFGTETGVYTKIRATAGIGVSQSVLLSGLTAGTTYYVTVGAIDQKENATWSTEFSFTTDDDDDDDSNWLRDLIDGISSFFEQIFGLLGWLVGLVDLIDK